MRKFLTGFLTGFVANAVFVLVLAVSPPAAAQNPQSPQGASIPVTPATFAAALVLAKGGDVLAAAPGDYGSVVLKGKTYSPPLTIRFGKANLSALWIASSGVEVWNGFYAPNTVRGAVYVSGAKDVHLHGINVTDHGVYTGVVFRNAARTSLEGSTLKGSFVTVQCIDSDWVNIDSNAYSDFTRDGITSASCTHIDVTHNTCIVSVPTSSGHPDCGQFWSALGDPKQSDYVTIRGNRAEGYSQGFNDFGSNAIGHLTIESNDLHMVFPQAVAAYKATGAVVRFNHVSTMAADPKYGIKGLSISTINTPAPGVLRCGNVVEAGGGKLGVTDPPCAR